jgi:hypothetical protein
MKRTWAGEVRNVSLLVASAVNSEGCREILGICEGAKEDKSGWSAFLRHLVDRGLSGVQLISPEDRELLVGFQATEALGRFHQALDHVTGFMNLAALDRRVGAEGSTDDFAQRLGAVDDEAGRLSDRARAQPDCRAAPVPRRHSQLLPRPD